MIPLADTAQQVIARWMTRRDQIATRWRLKGSGFATMDAQGKRTEDPTLSDWAVAHYAAMRELRAVVRQTFAPPVDRLRAVQWVNDQMTNPLELEAAGEVMHEMHVLGGWDGDA